MAFIKNTIKKILRWALNDNVWENEKTLPDCVTGKARVSPPNIDDLDNGMNFTIFRASGGKLVRFSYYDETRDKMIKSLYIITDGENLGEELEHIITRESLSR